MPTQPQAAAALKQFLSTEVFLGRAPDAIDDDADLVDLGMDSLAILRLILFIEETFELDLSGEGLLDEGLSTVRAISTRIAKGAA